MYEKETRQRAFDLRRAGMTLSKISERTGVSTTQLSRWFDEEEVSPDTGVAYVYLFHCEQLGRTKIGRARDVYSRLFNAKTLSPLPITLIGRIQTEDDKKLEQQLQERYQDRHIRREWFDLSTAETEEIVQENGGVLEEEVRETGSYTKRLQAEVSFRESSEQNAT
ncbi:transcriptional regulator with XRE-family HTH domain [Salinibacter ruber]|uniref:GIY-YIG nuclease family protein n=1 Tax=Salinibacter ruber TaxID=146919 RepID=UPI00216A30A1|nr:GIY-YIG nuclease family protein [Salinibacter ruber]MCS3634324.1 transcriptional regulator with XRE-family HTH domain [Salinibacter ruber]MCS3713814.1 transcriptional regulator with XRE-family HTH domain [Salinibacter ruber]